MCGFSFNVIFRDISKKTSQICIQSSVYSTHTYVAYRDTLLIYSAFNYNLNWTSFISICHTCCVRYASFECHQNQNDYYYCYLYANNVDCLTIQPHKIWNSSSPFTTYKLLSNRINSISKYMFLKSKFIWNMILIYFRIWYIDFYIHFVLWYKYPSWNRYFSFMSSWWQFSTQNLSANCIRSEIKNYKTWKAN